MPLASHVSVVGRAIFDFPASPGSKSQEEVLARMTSGMYIGGFVRPRTLRRTIEHVGEELLVVHGQPS